MIQIFRMQRCNLCAQVIHRSSFSHILGCDKPLPETANQVTCKTCNLNIVSASEYEAQLITEEHFIKPTRRQKIMCVTCNNEFCQNVQKIL